jgi:hypothetical protein
MVRWSAGRVDDGRRRGPAKSLLARAQLGCVVVFSRGAGGHVGLVVGRTAHGGLSVLGGNQGDRVCIAAFHTARVLGYRLPPGDRMYAPLPLVDAAGSPSEA